MIDELDGSVKYGGRGCLVVPPMIRVDLPGGIKNTGFNGTSLFETEGHTRNIDGEVGSVPADKRLRPERQYRANSQKQQAEGDLHARRKHTAQSAGKGFPFGQIVPAAKDVMWRKHWAIMPTLCLYFPADFRRSQHTRKQKEGRGTGFGNHSDIGDAGFVK